MLVVRCIEKERGISQNLKYYILQDSTGRKFKIKSQRLREAIQNGSLYVTNLKLSKNGRLVNNWEEINPVHIINK